MEGKKRDKCGSSHRTFMVWQEEGERTTSRRKRGGDFHLFGEKEESSGVFSLEEGVSIVRRGKTH